MMGGMMMSKTQMQTTIKGQSAHKEDFYNKHKDSIQQTKDIEWIFKG